MTTVGLGISEQQSASVSLTPEVGELTPDERQRVNRRLGASIEKNLPGSIKKAFGFNLDAAKLVSLTGAIKTGVRSKLSAALGVTKDTGVGGAGAGAGVSLGGAGGVQGGVALGASIGIGGGVSAGIEGSPLAGVKVASGTDPKAIPGLTSGITVEDPAAAEIRVSAMRDIQVSLDTMITESLAGSGLSTQEQELVKAEVKPQLNKSVEDSFKSSFGSHPQFPHAMGERLLETSVRMPRSGTWSTIIQMDQLETDAPTPTGPYSFVIEGLEFRCSIIPGRSGRSMGGRTTLRAVGGAGGLDHDLEVRNYGPTSVKMVVDDILRDSGETLSAEADQAILGKRLDSWQRVKGHGRFALDRVLEKFGATWRVLRDGTVWLGIDTWPEVEPDGTVLDDDWGDGSIEIAPDTPSMVPGIVVRGQRVEEVVHTLSRSGLRTTLRSIGVRSVITDALEPVRHKSEYTKRYRCSVVSQSADGRVDVFVDDPRMKGRGVARCAVRVGIPGTTVKVPSGARCLVGWDDGDPELPYVSDWESGTAFTQIEVGESPRPVARIGDICKGFFEPGLQISGTIPAGPFTGIITVVTPFTCVIQGGSNALNVGSSNG